MNKTDWNGYYKKPYKTAGFSRRITTRTLLSLMDKYLVKKEDLMLAEFGGANSCFYDDITNNFNPKMYSIIDNNEFGLKIFKERIKNNKTVTLYNEDVLNLKMSEQFDFVFSVGLVEHFNIEGTAKAILSHLKVLKKGGIAIISFPTPTFLYRISRKISEMLGLWLFFDERPLEIDEVERTIKANNTLLYKKIIWPIFFTQAVLVVRKD